VVLISKAGREYRKLVDGLAFKLPNRWRLPLKGRLAVYLVVHVPDKRVRDLDNLEKCLFDSMQHSGIIENDGNIDEKHVVRAKDVKPGGQINVLIRLLE